MGVGRAAALGTVLAGLLWTVSGLIALVAGHSDGERVTYVAGLVVLVLALGCLGYSLVARAPAWLRLVVTVATPVLGLMVWVTLRDGVSGDRLLVLVTGVVLVVLGGVGMRRTRVRHAHEPVRGRRRATR